MNNELLTQIALLIADRDPNSRDAARRRAAAALANPEADYFAATRFTNDQIVAQIFDRISNAAEAVVFFQTHPDKRIRLEIDCNGGSVPAALEIAQAIKNHGNVHAVIHQSFSAANIIAAACKSVAITTTGKVMLHGARLSVNEVTAKQLREEADRLDIATEQMADALAPRIGHELVWNFMADDLDHYFSAAQAVEIGLADRIIDAAIEFPPRPCNRGDENIAVALLQALNRLTLAPDTVAALSPYFTKFAPLGELGISQRA